MALTVRVKLTTVQSTLRHFAVNALLPRGRRSTLFEVATSMASLDVPESLVTMVKVRDARRALSLRHGEAYLVTECRIEYGFHVDGPRRLTGKFW